MLFDEKTASMSLQRIPCSVRRRWWPQDLIRMPYKYIVHDLISVMQHNSISALDRGVLYLK